MLGRGQHTCNRLQFNTCSFDSMARPIELLNCLRENNRGTRSFCLAGRPIVKGTKRATEEGIQLKLYSCDCDRDLGCTKNFAKSEILGQVPPT